MERQTLVEDEEAHLYLTVDQCLTENDSLEGQGTLAGPGPGGDKKEDSGQDGAARPDADDQEPRSGSSTGNIKLVEDEEAHLYLTENDSLEGQGTLAGPGPGGDKKEDSGQDGAARPDADDQEPRSDSSTGNIKLVEDEEAHLYLTENDSLEGQGTLAGPGPGGDKKEDSDQDGAARTDADDQEPRSGSSTGNIKGTSAGPGPSEDKKEDSGQDGAARPDADDQEPRSGSSTGNIKTADSEDSDTKDPTLVDSALKSQPVLIALAILQKIKPCANYLKEKALLAKKKLGGAALDESEMLNNHNTTEYMVPGTESNSQEKGTLAGPGPGGDKKEDSGQDGAARPDADDQEPRSGSSTGNIKGTLAEPGPSEDKKEDSGQDGAARPNADDQEPRSGSSTGNIKVTDSEDSDLCDLVDSALESLPVLTALNAKEQALKRTWLAFYNVLERIKEGTKSKKGFIVCAVVVLIIAVTISYWKYGTELSRNYDEGTFTLLVRTGDRPFEGKDATVYAILHGEGLKSPQKKLVHPYKKNFKRGHETKFKITGAKFSEVEAVEIWREDSRSKSDWYIDVIFVKNDETKEKLPFPVFQWIEPNYHYMFIPYDTLLPQDDIRKDQRRMELDDKRMEYQLVVKMPGLPPQVRTLPKNEDFSSKYKLDIGWKTIKMKLAQRFGEAGRAAHWNTIQDMESLYVVKTFPPPSDLERWHNDVKFGKQRLAGVNNMIIRLCTKIPEKIAVTPEMVEPFLEGQTLDIALQGNKIFLIDYEIFEGIPTADGNLACAPLALFFVRADGNLVPIAIQLFQRKGAYNPVFLPSDPENTWIMAKMWFNNADTAIHEGVTHLGFTHLIMEGIWVSANRQMAPAHPLYKLLAPHFLYLLPLNSLALKKLLEPGEYIDQTMTVKTKGTIELIKRTRSSWRLDVEGTLPADLKARGVDDMAMLPKYYSRNDAMLLYDAIKGYVLKYINVYYVTDDDIRNDWELQAWRDEMVKTDEDGGLELQGVPGDAGKFTTREQLSIVLTSAIYTCSVAHAMANFQQYDEYAFPANYPSKLSGAPPTDKTEPSDQDLVNALLSRHDALSVMVVTSILSTRDTKSLGDFEVNYVYDPEAAAVVKDFRKELKRIEQIIDKRNNERETPYPYLNPSQVPNAISI